MCLLLKIVELLSVCVCVGAVREAENAPKLVEDNSTTDLKSKFLIESLSLMIDTFYCEHNDAHQIIRKKERNADVHCCVQRPKFDVFWD